LAAPWFDAWGGSWGESWGESWGDHVHGAPGGRSSSTNQKRSRKRWILPNGLHVFGTAAQALEIAEAITEQPVVIRQSRPLKPITIRLDDGDIEAIAIYPTARLSFSSSSDALIAESQTAEPDWITAELIMRAMEDRRRRRRRVATLLLLS